MVDTEEVPGLETVRVEERKKRKERERNREREKRERQTHGMSKLASAPSKQSNGTREELKRVAVQVLLQGIVKIIVAILLLT